MGLMGGLDNKFEYFFTTQWYMEHSGNLFNWVLIRNPDNPMSYVALLAHIS